MIVRRTKGLLEAEGPGEDEELFSYPRATK
jgi:hypothetical protein